MQRALKRERGSLGDFKGSSLLAATESQTGEKIEKQQRRSRRFFWYWQPLVPLHAFMSIQSLLEKRRRAEEKYVPPELGIVNKERRRFIRDSNISVVPRFFTLTTFTSVSEILLRARIMRFVRITSCRWGTNWLSSVIPKDLNWWSTGWHFTYILYLVNSNSSASVKTFLWESLLFLEEMVYISTIVYFGEEN